MREFPKTHVRLVIGPIASRAFGASLATLLLTVLLYGALSSMLLSHVCQDETSSISIRMTLVNRA